MLQVLQTNQLLVLFPALWTDCKPPSIYIWQMCGSWSAVGDIYRQLDDSINSNQRIT